MRILLAIALACSLAAASAPEFAEAAPFFRGIQYFDFNGGGWRLSPAAGESCQGPQVDGFVVDCNTYGGGVAGLRRLLWNPFNPNAGVTFFFGLRVIFGGIAALYFMVYALKLLFESEDENAISEVKSAYGHAVAGAAIVSASSLFVQAFGVVGPDVVTDNARNLITPEPIEYSIGLAIKYIRLALSVAVTAMITFQGVRLILLQGQESELEQQKKRFFHGLIGVAAILLASPIIASVDPVVSAGRGAPILGAEAIGVVNYLLQILGALAVIAIIIAGIMLVVSTKEELKDRAKKIVFGTFVALIVVISAYAIVNFVLSV